MEFNHISVLLNEVIDNLTLVPNGIYVDGTLGGGGHTREILLKTAPNGVVIGIDKDEEALFATKNKLSEFANRVKYVHSDFKNIDNILCEQGIDKIDGAILDLGVSSYQLDNRERGFSYMASDTKLDMRMDKSQQRSAYTVVNEYSEQKLFEIIDTFGEERFAKSIAKNIVKARENEEIVTTGQLVKIIESSIPTKFKMTGGHPAKQTFQAIRIEVNGELDGLKEALTSYVSHLKKGGRFAVITFHSLEDRIVKNVFKYLEQDCICDKRLPICVCGKIKEVESITRKPIIATSEEMSLNPRSKSAKLRIVQKIV